MAEKQEKIPGKKWAKKPNEVNKKTIPAFHIAHFLNKKKSQSFFFFFFWQKFKNINGVFLTSELNSEQNVSLESFILAWF